MKNGLTIMVFIFLFGCSQETTNSSKNKIIFLTDYFTLYTKAIKTDFSNRDKIYNDTIAQPILKTYFQNCEYSDLVAEQLSIPIQDTSELEHTISLINSNKEMIEKKIISTLLKCNKELKNEDLTIYILPVTKDAKEILKTMNGINGLTAGSKKILITIDPDIKDWEKMLEYAVAHEFHHAFWTDANFDKLNKWSLLEYLVFEGKADSYAHSLYPTIKAPWTCSLTDPEKDNLWLKIKPELNSRDLSFQREVMFGSKDFPIWGGYTLGYSIVQQALNNNKSLAPIQWTNLEAENVLKSSNFK